MAGARVLADLPYAGAGAPPGQRLDLYLPEPRPEGDRPLLVFIHGGAWVRGDKGEYGALGQAFASRGVALAAVNYRLSTDGSVRHPDHARDGAAALAWLAEQGPGYGYSPTRVFILGHSAGGHMAATWVTDPYLLKDAGLPAICRPRGYVGLAGIYDVAALLARHPDYADRFACRTFGPSEADWRAASPALTAPWLQEPWLLLHSDADELVEPEQSAAWAAWLREEHIPVEEEALVGISHYGAFPLLDGEPGSMRERVLAFIARW